MLGGFKVAPEISPVYIFVCVCLDVLFFPPFFPCSSLIANNENWRVARLFYCASTQQQHCVRDKFGLFGIDRKFIN